MSAKKKTTATVKQEKEPIVKFEEGEVSKTLAQFKTLAQGYASLGADRFYNAFARAITDTANIPQIQNLRIKAISSLPCNYTKSQLGDFLLHPTESELPIRNTSEGLTWTAYPYFKIAKSYADMLTYRYYVMPQYLEKGETKEETFKREQRLTDKIAKAFNVEATGHKIALQAAKQGKVFYILRSNVDKAHNAVNYVFAQQLPQDWCKIIGYNNISKYTISFDLMYFAQVGTDWTQYGDLFEPYMNDFLAIFEKKDKKKDRFVYASHDSDSMVEIPVKTNSGTRYLYADLSRINREGEGAPEMFQQNGSWCYFVSLPINRVWTFEIDDSTPIVATPFAGLLQTFAQQADYEAAQLSLIMNPLIKVFTGEIPYKNTQDATAEDDYRLSEGGRLMFEWYFAQLMAQNNTGGTALFTAPVENIKSHDFQQAANANDISSSFNAYGMEKAGLSALIPITDKPTQGISEISAKLESRYAERIYRTLESMINHFFKSLNLKYEWRIKIFGNVYNEAQLHADALKSLANGDLTAHYILAALDGQTLLDRLAISYTVKESGLLDYLVPPQTAYTQAKGGNTQKQPSKSDTGGAPTKTEQEKQEDKIIEKTEVEESETTE